MTAYIDGVHGDTNATYLAGDVAEENRLLVERTEEALRRAIKSVAPGRQLNVIGRVIESYAKRFGYGVVREYTGHGVHSSFHSGLVILHYDSDVYRDVMEPGESSAPTVDCETPVKALMEQMSAGAAELRVTENGQPIGRVTGAALMAKLINPRGPV